MQIQYFLLLLTTGLASSAAVSSPQSVRQYTRPITVDPPLPLNIHSVNHTFQLSMPAGFDKVIAKGTSRPAKLKPRFNPGFVECIQPAVQPVVQDCENLAVWVRGAFFSVSINPWEIVGWELGSCIYEIVNLDPCEVVDITTLSRTSFITYAFVQAGPNGCIQNGYDAFLEGMDPTLAFIMAGTGASPPYQYDGCT